MCPSHKVSVSVSKWIKAWVLSLVLALSTILWMPSTAKAVGSISTSMYAGKSHNANNVAHKRMMLLGTGIPETLQKIFAMLDTQNTGSISKQALKLALIELKTRGYMSVSLSDNELDQFLDKLVEKTTVELSAFAAASGLTVQEAAEDARLLAEKGPQIRY